jgi:hypothetical protein
MAIGSVGRDHVFLPIDGPRLKRQARPGKLKTDQANSELRPGNAGNEPDFPEEESDISVIRWENFDVRPDIFELQGPNIELQEKNFKDQPVNIEFQEENIDVRREIIEFQGENFDV